MLALNDGWLVVPKYTSYRIASGDDAQERIVLVKTPVALLAGFGSVACDKGRFAMVVNVQIAPGVTPLVFVASTRQ